MSVKKLSHQNRNKDDHNIGYTSKTLFDYAPDVIFVASFLSNNDFHLFPDIHNLVVIPEVTQVMVSILTQCVGTHLT